MRILRNKRDVLISLIAISSWSLVSSQSDGQDFQGYGRAGALMYINLTGANATAMAYVDGTFTYGNNAMTSGYDTLRACDYNGDGKADLIVYNSQTALAYIGMGTGTVKWLLE